MQRAVRIVITRDLRDVWGYFEVLPFTQELSGFINAGINPEDLSHYIKSLKIGTLRKSGAKKIMEGLTTIEEVVAAIVIN